MTHPPRKPARSGFTLLEVMVALLLMAAIAGMVFGIARTSLNLGQAIIDKQAEEMEQQAFFEFLSRRFSTLPGNARLELVSEESGRLYLSDLTLQNVPMSFSWGGGEQLASAVRISTVPTRSGYLDIVMRYYENEILEGSGSDFDSTADPEEPFAEIVLLRNVAYFEWRVMDANDMEWIYDWDQAGRLPLQIELQMAMGAEGKPLRHVFWLPPKLNPEVVMRQMGAGQDGQAGVVPLGGQDGQDGTDISIEVNTPGVPEGGGQ